MSKVLYIHIGNFKTGTSAIQKFCHDNYEALKKSGLYYFKGSRPQRNKTNHGRLSLELYKQFGGVPPRWYVDDYSYEQAVSEIKQEIKDNSEFSKFLISSEEFYRFGGLANVQEAIQTLKQSFGDLDIKIKIIMYAREPLDFLASMYNQITKKVDLPTRTFNDYFNQVKNFEVDPNVNYNEWSAVFGEENIIVKEYQYKGNQHLQDFLEIMVSGFNDFPDETKAFVNTGVKGRQLEANRIAKLVKGYANKQLNKNLQLNGYVNSAVLQDAKVLRQLSQRVDDIYQKNYTFYAKNFSKVPTPFDVFSVIERSANLNYIDVHAFWRNNPSIDGLIAKAVSIKDTHPQLALELFEIAKESRPNGKFIQKKIEYLSAAIDKN